MCRQRRRGIITTTWVCVVMRAEIEVMEVETVGATREAETGNPSIGIEREREEVEGYEDSADGSSSAGRS